MVAIVLALGLVAGAACSGDDDAPTDDGDEEAEAPTEPPGWDVVDGPPVLEPLAIEEEPLWSSESVGPYGAFDDAVFRDDSIVLSGHFRPPGGDRSTSLGVLDAATGEMRWMLSGGDDLPGGDGSHLGFQEDVEVVDHGGSWAVLVEYNTPDEPLGQGVAALSSEDGHVLWKTPIALGTSPPDVIELGGGWAVLVEYQSRPGEPYEEGVAALSSEDGRVLWKTPIVAGVTDDDADNSVRTVYDGDGFAVAVAGPLPGGEGAGFGYGYTEDQRLVAIDTTDGTTLWERSGMEATSIAGDTVYARVAGENDVSTSHLYAESVVALDAATGDVRWDLSDQHAESHFFLAAGYLAVVAVPGSVPASQETLVVDASSGREVDSFGTTMRACGNDGELIACYVAVTGPGPDLAGDDVRLATLQIDDRAAAVSEATLADPNTASEPVVVDGRVIFDSGSGSSSTSVDRFANIIDAELPGRYLAMSDRYAIFDGEYHYTVHAIAD